MYTKFFTSTLILVGLLSSCENGSNKEAETLEIADDAATQKANEEAIRKLEAEAIEFEASVTSLKFDKLVHDFGNLKLNSENNCTFIVTNTGKKPLVITDVKASCGCTTPTKPEGPIAPGKSDKIEVEFKPSSESSNGIPTEKTVTITANIEEKIAVVKIKAMVSK